VIALTGAGHECLAAAEQTARTTSTTLFASMDPAELLAGGTPCPESCRKDGTERGSTPSIGGDTLTRIGDVGARTSPHGGSAIPHI
jgi:hypothetical protein